MLVGTTPSDRFLAHAATMPDFATEAVTFDGASVFQAMFEIRVSGREVSLPPALHPTNPPSFLAQIWHCPDSPWGAFHLAQGRIGSRSGLRPRGFVQSAVCDNAAAGAALAARFGLPCVDGAIELSVNYHGVFARVTVGDTVGLAIDAVGATPLGPDDIAYSSAVALAHTPRGVRLVQIDTELAVTRAERMTPRLVAFDAAALGMQPAVEPYHPVAASVARGTLTLEKLRFVCRPDELAFSGTEPV